MGGKRSLKILGARSIQFGSESLAARLLAGCLINRWILTIICLVLHPTCQTNTMKGTNVMKYYCLIPCTLRSIFPLKDPLQATNIPMWTIP